MTRQDTLVVKEFTRDLSFTLQIFVVLVTLLLIPDITIGSVEEHKRSIFLRTFTQIKEDWLPMSRRALTRWVSFVFVSIKSTSAVQRRTCPGIGNSSK